MYLSVHSMQKCPNMYLYQLLNLALTALIACSNTGWYTSRRQTREWAKMPLFQLSVSKLNSTGDQKQAWGAWESCKHPCGTPAPSTWQRSAKMNQSYLRLEGGCADSAIPVWNSTIGKRQNWLTVWAHVCVSLCAFVWDGKNRFNMLRRFPLPPNWDFSEIECAASKQRVQTLWAEASTRLRLP